MAIKIPVEKTEYCNDDGEEYDGIVIRADIWRKIMPVLRTADQWWRVPLKENERLLAREDELSEALLKLEKHLERKP